MFYNVTTPPAIEPVSIADMRAHCRIDHTDEDDLLAAYVAAARSWCEEYCRRSFITQTITLRREAFTPTPADDSCGCVGDWRAVTRIRLPRGPIQSVTGITYVDTAGDTQTLATTVYEMVDDPEMAFISLRNGQAWPSINCEAAPVSMVYVAGYGDMASNVPAPIRHAIKMMSGQFFEFREPIISGTVVAKIPMAVEALLGPYRVLGGFE